MNKRVKILTVFLCIVSVAVYILSRQYANRDIGNKRPEILMDEQEVVISVKDPIEAVFQGVTAKDKEDGDVTESLLMESMSNMDKSYARNAVLVAFDKNGNVTKSTRTVSYSDYTSPEFSISTPLTVQATKLSSILDGVRVTDLLDGDLSRQVQLETAAFVEPNVTDDYKANLMVTNSAGDTVDIPVIVTACTITDMVAAPAIELKTYLIYLNKGEAAPNWKNYLKSVTVNNRTWLWDNDFYLEPEEDGTIPELRPAELELQSSDLKVQQEVDTNTPGVYEIDYYVEAYKANPAAHVRLYVVVRE